ncbi:MAG: hypothetical protein PHX30_05760 [Candidatus Pacebacteria bacterium]|nr:hypothetical protein [Candidatus Paceibacterota bacterium]
MGKIANISVQIALIVISLYLFAFLLSWKVSILITVVIYSHELGHALSAMRRKIRVRGIYMLPPLGAATALESKGLYCRKDEAWVNLMGPATTIILCLPCFAIFAFTGNKYLVASAGLIAAINLMNLIPLMPFDGGMIVYSIMSSVVKDIRKRKNIFFLSNISLITILSFAGLFYSLNLMFFALIAAIYSKSQLKLMDEEKEKQRAIIIKNSISEQIKREEEYSYPDEAYIKFLKKGAEDAEKYLEENPIKIEMSKREVVQNTVSYFSVVLILLIYIKYSISVVGWDFVKIALTG